MIEVNKYTKATLPLRCEIDADSWVVFDAENTMVADTLGDSPFCKEQAELICRAVNSHEAMKDALEKLLCAAIECDPFFEREWPTQCAIARAAMKKAGVSTEDGAK